MTLNGFDKIAFIYDYLARVVFGRSISDSQKYFLDKIEDDSKVLILGGGSGWLLEELLTVKPNCEVWYIEASGKMITLSQKKIKPFHSVHFIHGTEQNIPESIRYDAVITNFYLDLFTEGQLSVVVNRIGSSLKSRSLWIATDFVDNHKTWQKVMLKTMYWFFRTTCGIGSRQLPAWRESIQKISSEKMDSKSFYKDFIETRLYRF